MGSSSHRGNCGLMGRFSLFKEFECYERDHELDSQNGGAVQNSQFRALIYNSVAELDVLLTVAPSGAF